MAAKGGLNRRAFLSGVSLGAMGAACSACAEPAPPAVAPPSPNTFSFGEGNRLRLAVPGLRETVRVAVAGDTHFALVDERDAAYEDGYRRFLKWGAKPPTFEAFLKKVQDQKSDVLALVGDILSCPSFANVEYVSRTLARSGLDWMYVSGNHDWHFEGVPGSDMEQRAEWIPARLKPLYRGANPLFHSRVVKGLRLVMIDDSTYEVTEEQLAFWKAEAAKGDPVVLLMHIPLWTEGWGLFTCGNPEWGAAKDPYWQIEKRQRWAPRQTPTTFAFREAVLNTPNLAAVLTGHIHTFLAAQERGRLMFSAPCNISGAYLDVTFVPA